MNILNLILLANLLETFKLFFKQATDDSKVLGPGATKEEFDNFDFQFSRFDKPYTMGDVLAVPKTFEVENLTSKLLLIAVKIYDSRDSESWITLNVSETQIQLRWVIKDSEKNSGSKDFGLPKTPEDVIQIAKYFINEVYTFAGAEELQDT